MIRRRFVGNMIAGLVIAGMSSILYRCRKPVAEMSSWEPEVLSRICGHDKLVFLGLKYRQQSAENNREELIQILEKDMTDKTQPRKSYLDHKITDDFRNDRTVLIDGWILSITEARQCALVSFEAQ